LLGLRWTRDSCRAKIGVCGNELPSLVVSLLVCRRDNADWPVRTANAEADEGLAWGKDCEEAVAAVRLCKRTKGAGAPEETAPAREASIMTGCAEAVLLPPKASATRPLEIPRTASATGTPTLRGGTSLRDCLDNLLLGQLRLPAAATTTLLPRSPAGASAAHLRPVALPA